MPFTNRTFVKTWCDMHASCPAVSVFNGANTRGWGWADHDLRYEPAAVPLYAALAGVFSFAGWTIYRQLASNEVVLRHHSNPFPWQKVDPNAVPPAKRAVHDTMIANVKASGVNKPVGEEPLTGASKEVPKHW